jgi:hypothetical protein
MKYRTLFTDKDRPRDNINGSRYAWNTASSRHCVAFEFTLTARPYGQFFDDILGAISTGLRFGR